jgi:hypothetical protein
MRHFMWEPGLPGDLLALQYSVYFFELPRT